MSHDFIPPIELKITNSSKSFITGSQAYGTPTASSDLDLVLLVPSHVAGRLFEHSEATPAIRFGMLNILVLCEDNEEEVKFFHKWKKVTEELIKRKPVTREEAIKARIDAGIEELPRGVYFEEKDSKDANVKRFV